MQCEALRHTVKERTIALFAHFSRLLCMYALCDVKDKCNPVEACFIQHGTGDDDWNALTILADILLLEWFLVYALGFEFCCRTLIQMPILRRSHVDPINSASSQVLTRVADHLQELIVSIRYHTVHVPVNHADQTGFV